MGKTTPAVKREPTGSHLAKGMDDRLPGLLGKWLIVYQFFGFIILVESRRFVPKTLLRQVRFIRTGLLTAGMGVSTNGGDTAVTL